MNLSPNKALSDLDINWYKISQLTYDNVEMNNWWLIMINKMRFQIKNFIDTQFTRDSFFPFGMDVHTFDT